MKTVLNHNETLIVIDLINVSLGKLNMEFQKEAILGILDKVQNQIEEGDPDTISIDRLIKELIKRASKSN